MARFLDGGPDGHLDLPRARAGGFAGGFFAVFSPTPAWEEAREVEEIEGGGFRVTPPDPVPRSGALEGFLRGAGLLFRIEERSEGRVRVVESADELDRALERGVLAAVLHMEGAEAVDPELETLPALHRMGLRSLGPVWSRPNAFGHGVPFRFPALPEPDPGLTDAGRRLVRRCNQLGILLDLSHLNGGGFDDVARLSDAPLVATHSNAWALCPSPRNLTDDQLDRVAASRGVVGVNFHRGFLRPDGRWDEPASIEDVVEHVAYMVARMGVDHVALGSDFDGADMPGDLADARALPDLVAALSRAGFSDDELRRIARDNWRRVLRETWGG